jgi:hypothetical protein
MWLDPEHNPKRPIRLNAEKADYPRIMHPIIGARTDHSHITFLERALCACASPLLSSCAFPEHSPSLLRPSASSACTRSPPHTAPKSLGQKVLCVSFSSPSRNSSCFQPELYVFFVNMSFLISHINSGLVHFPLAEKHRGQRGAVARGLRRGAHHCCVCNTEEVVRLSIIFFSSA